MSYFISVLNTDQALYLVNLGLDILEMNPTLLQNKTSINSNKTNMLFNNTDGRKITRCDKNMHKSK